MARLSAEGSGPHPVEQLPEADAAGINRGAVLRRDLRAAEERDALEHHLGHDLQGRVGDLETPRGGEGRGPQSSVPDQQAVQENYDKEDETGEFWSLEVIYGSAVPAAQKWHRHRRGSLWI